MYIFAQKNYGCALGAVESFRPYLQNFIQKAILSWSGMKPARCQSNQYLYRKIKINSLAFSSTSVI
ncbi:MAG: hypothetical protein J7K84_10980, partial [Deltaproteobacteria bacterium]|nr:hypothetical protein [Deltaproteobacteria bacterium]